MPTERICILFFSLFCFQHAFGQTCVRYGGEAPLCAQFVPNNTLIYIQQDKTYESVITGVKQQTTQAAGFVQEPCLSLLLKLACSQLTFCVQVGNTSFGQPVCRPICTDTLEPCKSIYAFSQSPDCYSTDQFTNIPTYTDPGQSVNKTSNGDTVSVTCNNLQANGSIIIDVTCSFPTAKTRDGKCNIMCPDPMYTDQEYEIVDIVVKVSGWVSFGVLLVITVTFFLDKPRQAWPVNIPYLMCISSLVQLFFAVLLPTFYNIGKERNSHFCGSPAEASTQEDGNAICILQGMAMIYVGSHIDLWAFFWCLIIILRMKFPTKPVKFNPWGYIVCGITYGVPAILVISGLAARRIGYGRGSAFCVTEIIEDPSNNYKTVWVASLLVWPTLILCVVITCELIYIIRVLYIMYKNVESIKKGKGGSFQYEKRMIIFLTWTVAQQTPAFAFYFRGWSKENSLIAGYQEWIACEASGGANCGLTGRPEWGLLVASSFVAVTYASIGAFAFGLHNQVWQYWRPKLKFFGSTGTTQASSDDIKMEKLKKSTSNGSEVHHSESNKVNIESGDLPKESDTQNNEHLITTNLGEDRNEDNDSDSSSSRTRTQTSSSSESENSV